MPNVSFLFCYDNVGGIWSKSCLSRSSLWSHLRKESKEIPVCPSQAEANCFCFPETDKARSGFGPEPIAEDFNCEWFVDKLRKRNTPVKAALLDQSFVAGLGNIYVDEALWRARVRPTRKAKRVTKKEALELCRASGDVMKESIKVGGTTFQHFVDTGGQNGNFTDYLKVFGQQGTACPRQGCKGALIKKIRCAGRGTHYCPSCQK